MLCIPTLSVFCLFVFPKAFVIFIIFFKAVKKIFSRLLRKLKKKKVGERLGSRNSTKWTSELWQQPCGPGKGTSLQWDCSPGLYPDGSILRPQAEDPAKPSQKKSQIINVHYFRSLNLRQSILQQEKNSTPFIPNSQE